MCTGVLLALATLALTACGNVIYKDPTYQYSGRPIPPSGLIQRVLAAYTSNGSAGGLEILDGYRDLRSNVQDTIKSFSISGYSAPEPIQIINFPEQTTGYILSYTDGALGTINYSKESASGTAASFGANAPSAAAAPNGSIFAGAAEQSGQLIVSSNGSSYALNLPNVYRVAIDQGNSVVLAMVRNSNTLYRVVKLPATTNPVVPPGAVDCEPLLLPVLCVVPVGGTYDRPTGVSFSLDGSTAYILDSGPEYGGTTAGVTFVQMAALNINNLCIYGNPSAACPTPTNPMSSLPVANPVPVPGGVTVAVSDGTNLYLAGQQLQATGPYTGLFAGKLSLLNLSSYTVGTPISISDGIHSRILFADNDTLWIGSSECANGVRAATAATELATQGYTDQAGNYNCLTSVTLGTATPAAQIVPVVVQSNVANVASVPVDYPNTDQNQYYYGNLTGLCWIQTFGKVYTAYGGQIHIFFTGGTGYPGTLDEEDYNGNVTIQGTVLDVAYMDALTNSAN